MNYLDIEAGCSDSDGVEHVPEVDDYDMGFIDDDPIVDEYLRHLDLPMDDPMMYERLPSPVMQEPELPLMEEPLDERVLAASAEAVDADSPNNPKMGIAVTYRISNPTEDQLIIHEQIHDGWLNFGQTNVGAHAWQLEMGGNTNRIHIQGLIVFASQRDRIRINALWKMFGVPRGRGTQSTWARNARDVNDCYVYCTKEDGTFLTDDMLPLGSSWMTSYLGHHEFGDFSEVKKQGKRSDIDSLRVHMVEQARKGVGFENFIDLTMDSEIGNPLLRTYSATSQIYPILGRNAGSQNVSMEVRVFYGDTESGKTRDAQQWLGKGYAAIEWGTNGKLLNYDGQEKVLINDLKGEYPYPVLIKMLDTTQVWRAPILYRGSIAFRVSKLAITCILPPSAYYNSNPMYRERELGRRLTKIYQYIGSHDCNCKVVDDEMVGFCNCYIRVRVEK